MCPADVGHLFGKSTTWFLCKMDTKGSPEARPAHDSIRLYGVPLYVTSIRMPRVSEKLLTGGIKCKVSRLSRQDFHVPNPESASKSAWQSTVL